MPFSPISGVLPDSVSALYFGGGYPERHAQALAANTRLMAAVRAFASAGGVVYAECGGLIYLSQSIEAEGEAPCSMGAFPFALHSKNGTEKEMKLKTLKKRQQSQLAKFFGLSILMRGELPPFAANAAKQGIPMGCTAMQWAYSLVLGGPGAPFVLP